MDKVLLIDAHNALWRAKTGFGPKKQKHEICLGTLAQPCNHKLLQENKLHCTCGQEWIEAEGRCVSQADERYVLIYNFFRNLRPIIELFSPDKCFFVLEGHPQFRYDLFADYKANRIVKHGKNQEEMDKFHESKREIVRLMQYLPITMARAADYECDDVIASLCDNLKDEDVTVLSSDSDFIQLLQRGYTNCKIYNPIKKDYMVAPAYPYVAWKCLVGDTADNIPGFAGVGPKKAESLLSDPKKFQKFLDVEENRSNFNIYKDLIEFRFVKDEDIEFKEGTGDFAQLREEFGKMKFESIINDKSWEKFTKTFNCLKF